MHGGRRAGDWRRGGEERRSESGGLTVWGGREGSVGDAAKPLQETEREVWAQAQSGGMPGATQRNPSQRGCEGRAREPKESRGCAGSQRFLGAGRVSEAGPGAKGDNGLGRRLGWEGF